MKNYALEYLKKLLEEKYGDLENNRGCYINGEWLSIEAIVELINEADEDC